MEFEMLFRALLLIAVIAAALAVVFVSIPAAVTAAVLGIFAFVAKGLA